MHNSVRRLRTERGWSQAALGEKLGVSRHTINAIEGGKYLTPACRWPLPLPSCSNAYRKDI